MAKAKRMPALLKRSRRRIDAADDALLRLFNERARSVLAIGGWKRRTGVAVYDPKREKEILHRVSKINGGPLDKETVVRLFERTRQRKGHAVAVGATARYLAEATFWVLKKGEPYREPIPRPPAGSKSTASPKQGQARA
mgnify:CR=1 FL=1